MTATSDLNYYHVEFNYWGRYCGPDPGTGPSEDLCKAEDHVEQTLTANGFDWRHAYSWPDGSLYKYIRTTDSGLELSRKLAFIFNGRGASPSMTHTPLYCKPTDPLKIGCETLQEYFDRSGQARMDAAFPHEP